MKILNLPPGKPQPRPKIVQSHWATPTTWVDYHVATEKETREDLVAEAERLAKVHRGNHNFKVIG